MADSECSSGKMARISFRQLSNLADSSLESDLFNKLCDELLAEILLRLPSKSAVRLQVVCKRWYSLVSSPDFIPRFIHIRHHSHRDVQSSMVFQYTHYCDVNYTCNSRACKQRHSDFHIISDSSLFSVFRLDYLLCPPTDLQLEASFDDLILCSCVTNPKEFKYYVINLLTKQWIVLPPPPSHEEFMEVSIGFLCVPPSCSLCECKPVDSSSHHKFILVRLCPDDSDEPLLQTEIQVFSSEDCQWRTLVVSSSEPLDPLWEKISLVAYRGMLHWLNYDCIVVYDPLNTPNTFSRIIHLPIQLSRFILADISFGVSQGRLCVMKTSGHDRVDVTLYVWELEDYDSGLWKMVYMVDLEFLIRDGLPESLRGDLYSFSEQPALSLHPENGDVIYLQMPHGVITLNMKSRIIEGYYPIKKNALFNWLNAFHLADQWWPTPVS